MEPIKLSPEVVKVIQTLMVVVTQKEVELAAIKQGVASILGVDIFNSDWVLDVDKGVLERATSEQSPGL